MMKAMRRTFGAAIVLVLVGLISGPAWAQPADGDGYPLEVDSEVIVRDDVVDDREPTSPAAVNTPAAETEVLGVSLAATGGQVLLLVALGTVIALLGVGVLAATRSRRGQTAGSRAG